MLLFSTTSPFAVWIYNFILSSTTYAFVHIKCIFSLPMTGVQFSAGEITGFFLISTASRPTPGSTQPPIQRIPGVKRAGRESNHSPRSIAEVKNTWNCTPAPPVRLPDVVFSYARGQLPVCTGLFNCAIDLNFLRCYPNPVYLAKADELLISSAYILVPYLSRLAHVSLSYIYMLAKAPTLHAGFAEIELL
jgi:hypothetical protein